MRPSDPQHWLLQLPGKECWMMFFMMWNFHSPGGLWGARWSPGEWRPSGAAGESWMLGEREKLKCPEKWEISLSDPSSPDPGFPNYKIWLPDLANISIVTSFNPAELRPLVGPALVRLIAETFPFVSNIPSLSSPGVSRSRSLLISWETVSRLFSFSVSPTSSSDFWPGLWWALLRWEELLIR